MCLAVPMRIESIEGEEAVAAVGGIRRRVRLDLVEGATVGSYVIVHAGFAISLLDEAEALRTLDLIREAIGTPAAGADR